MHEIDHIPGAPLYLIARSALDREAYRTLLAERLGQPTTIDSDFTMTAVWNRLRQQPAMVLVDADSPRQDALDAIQMINRLQPDTPVIVVSAALEPALVEPWGMCFLSAYVVKEGGIAELERALGEVAAGRRYFSEGIRAALDRGARSEGQPRLSRRESELLPLLARGLPLRDAARQMGIKYKTADSYRTSLLRKIGVRDRAGLIFYAIRHHIVDA